MTLVKPEHKKTKSCSRVVVGPQFLNVNHLPQPAGHGCSVKHVEMLMSTALYVFLAVMFFGPLSTKPVLKADPEAAKTVATSFATALVVRRDVDAATGMAFAPFLDFRGRLSNPKTAKTAEDIRDRLRKAVVHPNYHGVGSDTIKVLGTEEETTTAKCGVCFYVVTNELVTRQLWQFSSQSYWAHFGRSNAPEYEFTDEPE